MSEETPSVDDWPVSALLRGRAEVEVYARQHGLLRTDQMIVVEVRAMPRRTRPARYAADGSGLPNLDGTDVYGARPQSALVIHHDGEDWTP